MTVNNYISIQSKELKCMLPGWRSQFWRFTQKAQIVRSIASERMPFFIFLLRLFKKSAYNVNDPCSGRRNKSSDKEKSEISKYNMHQA